MLDLEEIKLYYIEKTNAIIDTESRVLVGILMKRIEVLEKEKSFTPSLYKNLTKEIIYEYSRNLKKLFELQFGLIKLEFKIKQDNISAKPLNQ